MIEDYKNSYGIPFHRHMGRVLFSNFSSRGPRYTCTTYTFIPYDYDWQSQIPSFPMKGGRGPQCPDFQLMSGWQEDKSIACPWARPLTCVI